MTTPAVPSGEPPRRDDDALTLVRFLDFAARYRRMIVSWGLGLGFVVGVLFLLKSRTWEVTASFVPQARRAPSALSGIAAQLGISVPAEAGTNPQFYADLLRARDILSGVIAHTYVDVQDGDTIRGDLATVLEIEGTPALRRDKAMRALRGLISPSVTNRTGVVNVAVVARSPELALQIMNELLRQVDLYNQRTRQSQAASERRFTEQRLGEVRDSLRSVENELQRFLQTNRDVRNSPELQFRQDRLTREVTLRQQLYTGLAQAYEQARIEEVRDTPVFTLVDGPELPIRPRGRGTVRAAIASTLLGGVLGLLVALLRESLAATRARAPELVEGLDDLRNRGWLASLRRRLTSRRSA